MYHIQTPLKSKQYRAYGVIVHVRTQKETQSNQAVAGSAAWGTSGHGFLIAS